MVTCTECGEQNPVGTEFCLYCHAFLAWDQAEPAPPRGVPVPRPTPVRAPNPTSRPVEAAVETRTMPRIQVNDADHAGAAPESSAPPAPDEAGTDHDLFRLTADQDEVTVPPNGDPTDFAVRITNTSGIVDGYALATPGAPDWLVAEPGQLSLLPGAEDTLTVRLRVVSPTLVPAQQVQRRVADRVTQSGSRPHRSAGDGHRSGRGRPRPTPGRTAIAEDPRHRRGRVHGAGGQLQQQPHRPVGLQWLRSRARGAVPVRPADAGGGPGRHRDHEGRRPGRLDRRRVRRCRGR